jgi:DNA-binding NarL/FixJ family response regulator
MNATNDDIVRRLDILIRLIATGACADRTQKEKIMILSSAGLSSREIADFLGTTPNTVSVQISQLKRGHGARRISRTAGGEQ